MLWKSCPSSTLTTFVYKSLGCTSEPSVHTTLLFWYLHIVFENPGRLTDGVQIVIRNLLFSILTLPFFYQKHFRHLVKQQKHRGITCPRDGSVTHRQQQPRVRPQSQTARTVLRKNALAITRNTLQTEMNHIHHIFYLELRILTILGLISLGFRRSFAEDCRDPKKWLNGSGFSEHLTTGYS